jgi:hypothetical protein
VTAATKSYGQAGRRNCQRRLITPGQTPFPVKATARALLRHQSPGHTSSTSPESRRAVLGSAPPLPRRFLASGPRLLLTGRTARPKQPASLRARTFTEPPRTLIVTSPKRNHPLPQPDRDEGPAPARPPGPARPVPASAGPTSPPPATSLSHPPSRSARPVGPPASGRPAG